MVTDLDLHRFAAGIPRGLRASADPGALTTGTLTGLDPAKGVAQVTIGGSDPVIIPAAPGIYDDTHVRILRSQLDGGRAVYCLGPVTAGAQVAVGTVTAVNTDSTLTVDVFTPGDGWRLPYVAGTYTVGAVVQVLRGGFGDPEIILGPAGTYTPPGTPVKPPPPSGSTGTVQTVTKTILPVATGSYGGGHWGWWNSGRYGGPSTLYQGQGWGSPAMVGLAVYGTRITSLHADAITSISVTVQRADSSTPAGVAPAVQPSSNGSIPAGAPAHSGDTATGPALAPGQKGLIKLGAATAEALRTGAAKGLAMVGGNYAGFYGTSKADGMALRITYQVTR